MNERLITDYKILVDNLKSVGVVLEQGNYREALRELKLEIDEVKDIYKKVEYIVESEEWDID